MVQITQSYRRVVGRVEVDGRILAEVFLTQARRSEEKALGHHWSYVLLAAATDHALKVLKGEAKQHRPPIRLPRQTCLCVHYRASEYGLDINWAQL